MITGLNAVIPKLRMISTLNHHKFSTHGQQRALALEYIRATDILGAINGNHFYFGISQRVIGGIRRPEHQTVDIIVLRRVCCGCDSAERMSAYRPMPNRWKAWDGVIRGIRIQQGKIALHWQKDYYISLCRNFMERRGIRAIVYPSTGIKNQCSGSFFLGGLKYNEFIQTHRDLGI